jgi:hypothetical protein
MCAWRLELAAPSLPCPLPPPLLLSALAVPRHLAPCAFQGSLYDILSRSHTTTTNNNNERACATHTRTHTRGKRLRMIPTGPHHVPIQIDLP